MTVTALEVVDEQGALRTLLRGPRLQLVEALRERPDSASGLAARLKMPRQTINYHLRQLEQAGLVELVEERGHGRCVERVLAPAASSFAVSPAALGPLAPDSRTVRDQASAEYLAARAGEVVRDVGKLLAGDREGPTLTLETQIRFAGPRERAAFARDLQQAVERLVSRYHLSGAGATFSMVVAVHPSAR
jgi:DNA-binding transcriptional ArsR family regulator